MRVNARLEPPVAKKLSYLKEKSGGSTSAVLKRAIELYYEHEVSASVSPLELLDATGFIGCAAGPAKLSEKYKEELTRSLRSKQRGHRR